MKPRKDLLLALSKHLDKVPKTRFRLEGWRFTPTRHTCKTAGCAVGHAPDVPEIAALGFTCHIEPMLPGKLDSGIHTHHRGWYAVQKLFKLTSKQAENLFSTYGYKTGEKTTPEMVARRIRSFIRNPAKYDVERKYA